MTGPTRAGLEAQIRVLRQEDKDTTVMLRFLADRIDELAARLETKAPR